MADFATVAEAEILFSEPLEQLASYNGADMHKYNMLYTIKFIEHVLTPESYYIKKHVCRFSVHMLLRYMFIFDRTIDGSTTSEEILCSLQAPSEPRSPFAEAML